MVEIAKAQPAILLARGDAMQTKITHRHPQFVARKPVIRVDPRGQRGDPLIGKAGHRLANGGGALAQPEGDVGGGSHDASSLVWGRG
jgi:hypothetical protein